VPGPGDLDARLANCAEGPAILTCQGGQPCPGPGDRDLRGWLTVAGPGDRGLRGWLTVAGGPAILNYQATNRGRGPAILTCEADQPWPNRAITAQVQPGGNESSRKT
jgi:hypothetical protein